MMIFELSPKLIKDMLRTCLTNRLTEPPPRAVSSRGLGEWPLLLAADGRCLAAVGGLGVKNVK